MDTEDEICARYAAELASIAALDRSYYLKPSPSTADRQAYAERQDQFEQVRSRFYAELTAFRLGRFLRIREFRPCRSIVRRPASPQVAPPKGFRITADGA